METLYIISFFWFVLGCMGILYFKDNVEEFILPTHLKGYVFHFRMFLMTGLWGLILSLTIHGYVILQNKYKKS
jgi:hypothetical protein